MHPTTILLISSPHVNWIGLRTMLGKFRHMEVIGEVHRRDESVQSATAEQPDVIFVGSNLPGLPIVPLVQELREISPASRVVVVGEPLDSTDRAYLAGLGVCGVLLWKDVTEDTLGPIVEVLRHDLRVVSAVTADQYTVPDRQRVTWAGDSVLASHGRGRS